MPSHSKKEKNCFPPISNRHRLSTSSNELDQSTDSYREPDSNQEPENTCESPIFKLPVIERTKSRSVTSISSPCSTLGSRQFSRDRPSRRSMCRSPSCPSNMGFARSDSNNEGRSESFPENGICGQFPHRENEDDNVKLPNIFRNASSIPSISPRHSALSNTWKTDRENGYLYSMRRTDSSPDKTLENNEQPHTHALLLPLRNVDNVSKGKKKKKKFTKSNSTGNFEDKYDNSSLEKGNSLGRWNDFENEQNQINGSRECLIEGQVAERSVDMVSARKMKKWMKQHPPKEGQVKA